MSEALTDTAAARPCGPLSAVVAAHHGYRVRGAEPGRHLGLPSPHLTLIFTLDDPLIISQHVDPAATPGRYRTLAGGLHASPAVIEHQGRQSGVQLQLDPLGRTAGELQERLRDAADWPARFALLDRQLGRGLLDPNGGQARAEVEHAWRQLRRSHGRVTVSALAGEVGWSERHLTASFRAEFGLTPKVAARVIRFDRARRRLTPGNGAAVAAGCGFADQSHLVRDFRAFTGLSPSGWLAAEVGNVQVTGPTDGADSAA